MDAWTHGQDETETAVAPGVANAQNAQAERRAAYQAQIVTHNSSSCIAACLASLLQQELPPARIVILDNASQDNTADVLRLQVAQLVAAHPASDLSIHINQTNVGYAAVHNHALRAALPFPTRTCSRSGCRACARLFSLPACRFKASNASTAEGPIPSFALYSPVSCAWNSSKPKNAIAAKHRLKSCHDRVVKAKPPARGRHKFSILNYAVHKLVHALRKSVLDHLIIERIEYAQNGSDVDIRVKFR